MRGIVILLIAISISACEPSDSPILRIAVSANMQHTMQALTEAFEETSKIPIETIVSSSGKLTAQLMQGAPYDIFVSADAEYPNTLYKAGLTVEKPFIYAYGQLVFWSKQKWTSDPSDLSSFANIAVANPTVAPYGKATESIFEYYDYNMPEKIVFGESIAQVNQFIQTGVVDAAYTAASTMPMPQFQQLGYFELVDRKLYPPIEQAIVAMNQTLYPTECNLFLEFIQSTIAQDILRNSGYIIPDNITN